MEFQKPLYERVLSAVERYGYGLTLAAAILWFARTDIILPMVESHKKLLDQIAESYQILAKSQENMSESIHQQELLLREIAQTHSELLSRVQLASRQE